MNVYKSTTFAQVYKESLIDLYNNPDYETEPRGLKIKENIGVTLILENPQNCLYTSSVRSSQKKYIAAELLWYFIGTSNPDFISKYASFWNTIKDQFGEVNSAYGNLIFRSWNSYGLTQYQWALTSLLRDKDTRQAILHFNTPKHQYLENKDFPCTLYGIFHIRNNKLHFTIHMRSNDAIWGLPTDLAFFTTLQSQMLNHLKGKYPELEIGVYTHVVDSLHIYERHFEVVDNLISSDLKSESLPSVSLNLIDNEYGTYTNTFGALYKYVNYNSLDLVTRAFSEKKMPVPNNILEIILKDPLFSWINQNINIL
jgi:thymidylate synthase